MRSLPIWRETPSAIAEAAPLPADSACRRCAHKGASPSQTCLPAQVGAPGGVLVVDSLPSKVDFAQRRPLASPSARAVRAAAEQAGVPVSYTTALRCVPASASENVPKLATGLEACRPYLHQTILDARPSRIIALGAPAIYALTGSVVAPTTTREGFAWLTVEGRSIPAFYCVSPLAASRNRFIAEWLREDFARALTVEPPTAPPELTARAHVVETAADAAAALESVRSARWTAVDAEWAGRPYDRDFRLLCLALTPAPEAGLNDPRSSDAFVFPHTALAVPAVGDLVRGWLRDPSAKKVGSYFKADTVAFHAAFGVWTRGVALDTRLTRRLLDPEASGALADMAHLVGRGGHKDELQQAKSQAVARFKREARKGTDLFGRTPLPPNALPSHGEKLLAGAETDRYGFAFVDPDLLYRYNAADTTVTAKLGAWLEGKLAAEPAGMQAVAKLIVTPAADAYARIESWGMGVDRSALETFRDYLDLQLAEIASRFVPYGYDPQNPEKGAFNPASAPSVSTLLFKTLKLKSTQQTPSGAESTDADALEALVDAHPVVRDLLAWRQLDKLRGTYAVGLLEHVRDDGRIHPSIHPDGARTGRTSSSAPNLQNVVSAESPDPEQAKLAKMLRDCFAPPKGHLLMEFDFSQQELRIAADLSGDKEMLAIFARGEDFHMRTAKLLSHTLWGITPEEVTSAHRREVKGCVFGLIYDDSAHGLAFRTGLTVEKASAAKDAIFGRFQELARWIKDRVRETQRTGYAWTWWAGQPARRRPLIEVAEDEKSPTYKTARRGAWNGPIQGTANEYLVNAAVQTVDWILGDGIPAKLLVTIHDSMLLEVRQDAIAEVREVVPRLMTQQQTKSGVILAADCKIGPTWARMKGWKDGASIPPIDD